MSNGHIARIRGLSSLLLLGSIALSRPSAAAEAYQIVVSNERSGDVTVINGADFSVIATIPVGKRPRGIHSSPDGKSMYVAVSGTPLAAPPQLDAHGNPIFKRGKDDDDEDAAESDKSADGIAILDIATHALKGTIFAGSDPEEFALSKDGTEIYVSNEDTKSASVVDIASSKVKHILPAGEEPEGVAVSPDGKQFYITCESGGDVFVFDAATFTTAAHFKVTPRPRSVGFLASGAIAFIPSESTGQLNVVDARQFKVLKVIALPEGARPMRVLVSPDDRTLYISNGRSGSVSALDARTYETIATIKVGTRPWGMAFSPDGKYLFTANGPSNDVSVIDLKTHQEIKRIAAGKGPWGIAVSSPARY